MKLRSITDIGIKREDNQDNYWCSRLGVSGEEVGIVCICDGMGGLDDGYLASKIVVSAVRDFFLSNSDIDGLLDILKKSNEEILNVSLKNGSKMGTTCTILYCKGGKYFCWHIGDSRCYKISNGYMNKLTEDHSALEKYRKEGKEISESIWKKYRNMLTRCLGVKESAKMEVYEGSYSDGDSFLLCSDGFWHYLDENDVSEEDLSDLGSMVKKCISAGETDNITVALLEV